MWALPFLTALCPCERYHDKQGKRHKTLIDWARQMVKQVKRWLPERQIVIPADSTFAALNFLGGARLMPRSSLACVWMPPCMRQRLADVLADPATQWKTLTIPFVILLAARPLFSTGQVYRRCAAWYTKPQATFSDTLASMRRWL